MKTLEQYIEDKVNKFIDENKTFTAHDITRELREEHTFNIPHDKVRSYVRQLFENGLMGDYTATLANFSHIKNDQPWIYHDINEDANNYNKPKTSTVHIANATLRPVIGFLNLRSTPIVSNNNSVKKYTVDARNTLCIPVEMVKKIGLKSGDKVYIHKSQSVAENAMYIDNIYHGAEGSYTVDKYGNVRITQSILQDCQISGKDYVISIDRNSIKVTLA